MAAESTITGAAAAMANTSEIGIAEQVIRYYEGGLGRVPAGVEVAYYVTTAETGLTPDQLSQGAAVVPQATWNQIASDFAKSPEFQFASSGAGVIGLLYQNILGRTPSAAEIAFYVAQQGAGFGSDLLLQEFVNSPEYQNKINPVIEQELIVYGSGVASGQFFSPTPTPMDAVTKAGEIGLVGMHGHPAPIPLG